MSASNTSIYSHRPMQPANVRSNPAAMSKPGQPSASLLGALDAVKQECEALQSEVNSMRHQRNDLEAQLDIQLVELSSIRRALSDLEAQHARVRSYYEHELNKLRSQAQGGRTGGIDPPPSSPSSIHPATHSPRGLGTPLAPVQYTSALAKPLKSPRERSASERDSRAPQGSGTPDDSDRERLSDPRDAKRHKSRREDAQEPSSAASTSRLPNSPINTQSDAVSFSYTSPFAVNPKAPLPHPKFAQTIERLRRVLIAAPPEYRKEHFEWQVIYNSSVKKAVDINLVHTFVHQSIVCCVQFSLDGRYVAVGGNRVTYIYDVQSGAKIAVLPDDSPRPPPDMYIRSVRFSPDGKLLATGGEDKKIKVWDIAKCRILRVFEGHEQEIYSLDFSRDGRYIVSGSADATLRIWSMEDNSCRILSPPPTDPSSTGVTSVSISPNSLLVAGGCLDKSVLVWDIRTGALLQKLQGHEDSVYSVAFSPDGKSIISGSLDMTLRLWNVSSITKRLTEPTPRDNLNDLSQTPSSSLTFVGHRDYVLTAAVTTDSRWVISGSKDRSLKLWDARTGDLQFALHGHQNSVISLAISPLGGMMVTGSGDSCARIWTYSAI